MTVALGTLCHSHMLDCHNLPAPCASLTVGAVHALPMEGAGMPASYSVV